MRPSWRKILIIFGLLGWIWFVFAQTGGFDWVRYDDNEYVYRSAEVTGGVTAHNVVWAFTHIHAHNWHPLTTLSHMLDCQLFGVTPGAHHVTNVIIHSLAAVGLFVSLDSLTGKVWRSAAVSAVFAIHPLRAESVAWIAERKDVLSGLFFMLTLLAWRAYAAKPSPWRYAIALIAGTLGLLSKPMLVTLPIILLLIDYWPLRRFASQPLARLLLEKIPFVVAAIGSAVGTLLAQGKTIATMGFSLPLRLENAIVSYCIYLRQLFWPVDLAVLYPHPERLFPVSLLVGCTLLLVVISASVLRYRNRYPFLFVGWLWYVAMLTPVIGIVQVGRQSHADRYTYLPLIGVTIAIVWLSAEWSADWRFQKAILSFAAASVLIPLTACARHQTRLWQNADALWTHTLAVTTNNDGAHLAYSTALAAEQRTEEAIAHMREAARIRPSNVGVFGDVPLGGDEKQVDAGIVLWSTRIEEQPNDVNAHDNLGVLLVQKGQPRAAISEWQRALEVSADDGNAKSNLAWALATAPDDSLRDGRRAVELAESVMKLAGGANPLLHRTLAAAYAEVGRFEAAIATAEHGRILAEREQNRALATELAANVEQYKKGMPLRDSNLRPRQN